MRALAAAAVFALATVRGGAFADDGAALPAARFVAPRTAEARKAALAAYGGDAATEKAVEAGLDWLARHQEADGSWDADGFPSRCEAGGAKCDGIGKGQHGEEVPCPFDE